MNRKAKVVIGGNWGDEGKGLMTDYFASQNPNTVVVRFNGGANAGHTVTRDNGKRHVHSHFSAGTLAGADTFLSQHFVSCPVLFFKELEELKAIGFEKPTVFVDPRSIVTTPFDVFLNRALEDARGTGKHGSVGVGLNETVERSEHEDYRIEVVDLFDEKRLASKMKLIYEKWVNIRARRLHLNLIQGITKVLWNSKIMAEFFDACRKFIKHIQIAYPSMILQYENIVFEGAQGLALDQNNKEGFPHLTRSNTGLQNAVQVSVEAGIVELEAVYATRCYLTRHGMGPLNNELGIIPYKGIIDKTNVPNAYQDSIRYSYFDVSDFVDRVSSDFLKYAVISPIKVLKSIAVTCLDQTGNDTIICLTNNKFEKMKTNHFVDFLSKQANSEITYKSFGPTNKTIFSQKNEKKTVVFGLNY